MATSTRLGLCLSGGGFRASLFHIGVLAAMAEREMLHRVEALSTVSGGSIIGAYYYLKVRQLLEGKRPGCPKPTPALYRTIMHEVESDFLEAVQKNLRLRLFDNPIKNYKLAREDYSRCDRLAELLNEHFYDAVAGQRDIRLRDIYIRPEGSDVKASVYNRDHEYKIPVLILNATCLNTGHPWHFTGAYVGEPPQRRAFLRAVDSNVRMERLSLQVDFYYEDDRARRGLRPLSDRQKHKLTQITLADAVASSAAVPGIFPPLALHELYETPDGEEIVIELADGGVYDNQGVDALFHYGCSHFVISDASGQLEDERILGTQFYQVVQRSSDVMMNKIRNETLYRVQSGHEAQVSLPGSNPLVAQNGVAAYALMHLRQSFTNTPRHPFFPPPVDRPGGLVYRLSGIRTDLDSFSHAEAHALMYDGYCLTHERMGLGFALLCNSEWSYDADWNFLKIRAVLRNPKGLNWLRERLRIGSLQFFKPFLVKPVQAWALTLVPLLVVLPALWWALGWFYGPARQGAGCDLGFYAPGAIILFEGRLSLLDVAAALALLLSSFLTTQGSVRTWLKSRRVLRWLGPRGVEVGFGLVFAVVMLLVAAVFSFYRRFYDQALFLKEGRYPPES